MTIFVNVIINGEIILKQKNRKINKNNHKVINNINQKLKIKNYPLLNRATTSLVQ